MRSPGWSLPSQRKQTHVNNHNREPKKKRGRPAKAAETKTAKAPAAAAKKGKATKKDAKSDSPKTTTSALEADLAAANQEDDAAADGQRKSIFGGDTDTEIAA